MRLTSVLRNRRNPINLNHSIKYNNEWHEYRELALKDSGDRKALTDLGFPVYSVQQVIETPYLHQYETPDLSRVQPPLVKSPLPHDEFHPKWHALPVAHYGAMTRFPRDHQLKCAKNVTKTVELNPEGGLPDRIYSAIPKTSDETHFGIMKMIKETQLFDATQRILPRNYRVPYIGWHAVNDKMSRKMEYDVTKMSWQRKTKREFGIPSERKQTNLMKGFIQHCDRHYFDENSALVLNKTLHPSKTNRQYFYRGDTYSRVALDIPLSLSSGTPIQAFSTDVESTKTMEMYDLYPFQHFTGMWEINVYQEENNFPILHHESRSPFMHTCISIKQTLKLMDVDTFHSQSLMRSFAVAVGQARLLYGHDFKDILPQPVVIQHIYTDGREFHFSAFQLNTLDLTNDDGVKNMYWKENDMSLLYTKCDEESARPNLEGYNPEIYNKILGMYIQEK